MSQTRSVTVLGGKDEVQLPGALFDVQTNVPLIHQVVVAQLAAARQGTHATKTRGEVSGGGAKPWRQKGTGRARQGSRRAPQWVGGGTVHGPQPRSYAQRTPKKMIAQALLGALSDRARDGRIHVIDQIVAGDTPSTKAALQALAAVDGARLLVVLSRDEDLAWLSLRNVASIHLITVDQLNAYDVLVADDVVFSTQALEQFTAREPIGHPVEEESVAEPAKDDAPAAKAEPVAKKAAAKEPEPQAEQPADEPVAQPVKAEPVEAEVVEATEAAESPYGEGSYVGDNPPDGYDIKGNQSMKYHTPSSPYYTRTKAEVWFNSVEAAEAAGFVSPHAHAADHDGGTK